jgi:hypothetical protein
VKADLVSPVAEVPATLTLADGQRLGVAVFVPLGQSIAEALEEPDRRFLPVTGDGGFRLVSRAQVAVVTVPIFRAEVDAEAPVVRRPVVVGLVGGGVLRGALLFVPAYGRGRVADHLNQEGPSFVLRDGDQIHIVSKSHVLWVEEAA